MKIPEGFPGFTTVTSFGTGLPLVPDIVSSNQSADFFYEFGVKLIFLVFLLIYSIPHVQLGHVL